MCSGAVLLPCKAHLDAFFLRYYLLGRSRLWKFLYMGAESFWSPPAEQLLPTGPFPRREFSENTSTTSLYCSQSSVLSSPLPPGGVPPPLLVPQSTVILLHQDLSRSDPCSTQTPTLPDLLNVTLSQVCLKSWVVAVTFRMPSPSLPPGLCCPLSLICHHLETPVLPS